MPVQDAAQLLGDLVQRLLAVDLDIAAVGLALEGMQQPRWAMMRRLGLTSLEADVATRHRVVLVSPDADDLVLRVIDRQDRAA